MTWDALMEGKEYDQKYCIKNLSDNKMYQENK